MKHGVSFKINVSEIDKARLYKGEKGTYLSATVFIDPDNKDEYGNNGMITQDVSKEEREAGKRGAILGNVKVFWSGEGQVHSNQSKPSQPAHYNDADFDDSEMPF